MKSLFLGLFACVLCWGFGEMIVSELGFSYGGGLLGFFLCTAALRLRIFALERIEAGASFLVRHLAFPLVGLTASVVFDARDLLHDGPVLVVGAAVSALFVLVFVGAVTTRLAAKGNA